MKKRSSWAPKTPSSHYHAGMIYHRLGEKPKAQRVSQERVRDQSTFSYFFR